MAEPTTSAAAFIAATTGLTLFGVATGLHPGLLLAGMAGGLWALNYLPRMAWYQRVCSASVGAVVASWFAPAVSIGISSLSWWPKGITLDIVQFPVAVVLGLLAHSVIGPAMLSAGKRKAEELGQ